MGAIEQSFAGLRIFGDHLNPDEFSARLGATPTDSYRKDDIKQWKTGQVTRNTGMWLLDARKREPEDLDGQVQELFSGLSTDLAVWQAMAAEFKLDLFVGLFMRTTNDGFSFAATTMAALAARGVEVQFDIYAPSSDEVPG